MRFENVYVLLKVPQNCGQFQYPSATQSRSPFQYAGSQSSEVSAQISLIKHHFHATIV